MTSSKMRYVIQVREAGAWRELESFPVAGRKHVSAYRAARSRLDWYEGREGHGLDGPARIVPTDMSPSELHQELTSMELCGRYAADVRAMLRDERMGLGVALDAARFSHPTTAAQEHVAARAAEALRVVRLWGLL